MRNFILIYDRLRQGLLNLARTLLFSDLDLNKNYSKILIVRKGTIGDHAVCQPIYSAIQEFYKNAQLHLLTSNGSNSYAHISLLPEAVFFDDTLNFEDNDRKVLINKIKSAKYDLVIELPQDLDTIYTQLRNMLVYKYCGIKTGIGWAAGISFLFKRYRFLNISLPREFDKHKQNLQKQGLAIAFQEKYLPVLDLNLDSYVPNDLNWSNTIAIAPGAKLKSKQWSKENYKDLVLALIEKGFSIVLVGGKKEGAFFADLTVLNLCGKLSINQTRTLLSKCALLVCNDSGPMHLANAVDTPLIALFGARSYPKAWWPKETENVKVVFKQANYPLAYIGNSALDDQYDKHLNSITVHEVLIQVDALISLT